MTEAKANNDLMVRLAGVWRRGRRLASLRGACHVTLWAFALGIVVFLIDWKMDLTGVSRLALIAGALLVLAATAYLAWWRHLRPHDPVTCALEVERAYPEFGGLLLTYVQFHDKGIVHEGASPTLVVAMLHQAEERGSTVPFQEMVRFGSIWKLYLSVSTAALLLLVAAAMNPGFAKAFIVRVLIPFSEQRYPTRTVIVETSGDLVVQHGHSAHLRAVVSGELPDEVTVRFRHQGDAVDTIRVGPGLPADGGHRVFSHEIKEVYRDFEYSFLAGDGISRVSRVRVVRVPDQEIQVVVKYPAYIGVEPREMEMPSFDAPVGSTIDWSVGIGRPVAGGRLMLDGDQAVDMSLTADKRSATVTWAPKDSFTYGFEWTDRETGLVFNPEVRYSVRMVPDQAPTIVMGSSVAEEKATVWKAVDLAFTAKDDHGLASARLVYKVDRADGGLAGGAEKQEEILVFTDARLATEEKLRWRVRDSIPDLAPGDVVSYAVEVLDRQPAPGGPGVGRSPLCRITIVSQEEYVKIAMEQRRRLLARIKSIHDLELEADKAIQSLLEKAAGEGK